ncbi:MAG TPA: aminotransferase class V-fold PLP-dependent enzyme, partial [Gaiellaceae bacterium]|nr:aminotransferase class V-fold PLP-dependent enzyme [Gaiellaceae bacterium]
MAEKRYLFTPGPTPVPPEVLEAMSRPIIHHRSSDFREILGRTLDRLHEIYRTQGDVLLYTASGTGGMESAVSNLTGMGDRVVVVSAGHFGERWTKLARNFGCEVDELRYEWGETPAAEDLVARLRELGGAKVVFITHSETSTGVVADVQALAAAAKEAGALVAVDAVSSLGAVPLETDAWGLDAVVSGSQKALMTAPGLATVSVSADAWSAVEVDGRPRYYFDWAETREKQERFDPSFTPAVSIV